MMVTSSCSKEPPVKRRISSITICFKLAVGVFGCRLSKSIKRLLVKNPFWSWCASMRPSEYKKSFFWAKDLVLLVNGCLERNRLVKGDSFVCKLTTLRETIAFIVFSEAFRCYALVLHAAWNGNIASFNMLSRRLYEMTVDLLFMFRKYSYKRMSRFVNYGHIVRYLRLQYLHRDLSSKEFIRRIPPIRLSGGKLGKGRDTRCDYDEHCQKSPHGFHLGPPPARCMLA